MGISFSYIDVKGGCCFLLDFQVNYGKLLWFLKAAASDDSQQSKETVGSNPRKTQGCHHHGQRYFLSFLGHSVPRLLELAVTLEALHPKSSPNVESLGPSPTVSLRLSVPFSRIQTRTGYLQQLHRFLAIKHVSDFMRLPYASESPHRGIRMIVYWCRAPGYECDSRNMFGQCTPGLHARARKGFRYQNQ